MTSTPDTDSDIIYSMTLPQRKLVARLSAELEEADLCNGQSFRQLVADNGKLVRERDDAIRCNGQTFLRNGQLVADNGKLVVELDEAIKKKNQAFVALSHFVTHYEVADYSEATFDEIEKVAVSLWDVVKDRANLIKVCELCRDLLRDLSAYNFSNHKELLQQIRPVQGLLAAVLNEKP